MQANMVHAPLRTFEGLRATTSTVHRTCSVVCFPAQLPRLNRQPLLVEATKKVVKKQQIILRKGIPGLGESGAIVRVPNGFYRNFLKPKGLALPVTEGILSGIEREKKAVENAAKEAKAKARAMAIALQTIGKFIIKKKVGENDQIFGSVTTAEVVDAIAQQTGRTLNKKDVELPEIKSIGSFDASIKLHPEVIGTFKIVVQREKNTN